MAALLLALAGCSAGTPDTAPAAPPGPRSTTPSKPRLSASPGSRSAAPSVLPSGTASGLPVRGRGPVGSRGVGAGFHLPLEAYLFSPAQSDRLDRARAVLVGECMHSYGLAWEPGPAGPPLGPRDLMDRRYGVTNGAEAGVDGYHLGARDPRTRSPVRRAAPTGLQDEVLHGVHPQDGGAPAAAAFVSRVNGLPVLPDGCSGRAERRIAGGGQLGAGDLARTVNVRAFEASEADPRVVKAFAGWSACMKQHGYSYPDPLAVMNDPRFQGRTPTRRERAVATADVACKERTGLVGVWFAVERGLQEKEIAHHKPQFASLLAAKSRQLAAATAALSTP